MAVYGVFESTNMASTHFAERIFDCVAEADIENGTFGHLGELADGESHIYKFVTGVVAGEPIVVVDQPAWQEDTCRITNQRRDQFFIPAGTPFRVRVVKVNDEFAINAACVTTATQDKLAVGAFLTVDSTTGKLVAADAATEGAVFEAEVMRKRMQGGKLVTAAHNYGYAHELYTAKVKVISNTLSATGE